MHWEAWRLVRGPSTRWAHRVVLASSATRFQVEPMARELAADHVLCTPVEVVDGIVTGPHRRAGAVGRGQGARGARARRRARPRHGRVLRLLQRRRGRPVPRVGRASRLHRPRVGAGARGARAPVADPALRAAARHAGADRRRADRRVLRRDGGGAARPARRSGCCAARARRWSTSPAPWAPTSAWRSRASTSTSSRAPSTCGRRARACSSSTTRASSTRSSSRSCCAPDFTGVAKKEAANVPGFGQFFRLAGVAFIDRRQLRRRRARRSRRRSRSCAPGTSLVIAPEGTRSATPRLGRSRRARSTSRCRREVPMVPIVLRNVGEVMWRGSQTVRAGTDRGRRAAARRHRAAGSASTIGEHVAEVRGMFLDTLANWPTERRPPTAGGGAMTSPVKVPSWAAGSWGTTVAGLAATNTATLLWARDPDVAGEINDRAPQLALPRRPELPDSLRATATSRRPRQCADVLVVGLPAQSIRGDARRRRAVRARRGCRWSRSPRGSRWRRACADAGRRRGAPRAPGRPARRARTWRGRCSTASRRRR